MPGAILKSQAGLSSLLPAKPEQAQQWLRSLPSRHPEPLVVPAMANQCWATGFISESLFSGRRFRTFNVVDAFNREALAIEVGLSLPALRVIRVLERIAAWRG